MNKVSTGSRPIDFLLDGGLEKDIITTFYGPAGSGKTNISLSTSCSVARSGKKVVFIDTEGGYSVERLKQLAGKDFEDISQKIILFKPTTFQEQKKYVFITHDYIKNRKEDIGLVVIDSISMLYRLELGDEEAREVNRELARQLQLLADISRKREIPVLVTNQVYNAFDTKGIEIVGGDLIKYWSKCLVELRILKEGVREAILKKHRYLPEERKITFKITTSGLVDTD